MRYFKMYMHPDWWYLFVSPNETAPRIGDSWQILQFSSRDEGLAHIKKAVLTKDFYLIQGKEVVRMLENEMERLEDEVTEIK